MVFLGHLPDYLSPTHWTITVGNPSSNDGDLLQLRNSSFSCWFVHSLKQLLIAFIINAMVILRNDFNKSNNDYIIVK